MGSRLRVLTAGVGSPPRATLDTWLLVLTMALDGPGLLEGAADGASPPIKVSSLLIMSLWHKGLSGDGSRVWASESGLPGLDSGSAA